MQGLLHSSQTSCDRNRLTISSLKSKIVVFHESPTQRRARVAHPWFLPRNFPPNSPPLTITEVPEFLYLGTVFDQFSPIVTKSSRPSSLTTVVVHTLTNLVILHHPKHLDSLQSALNNTDVEALEISNAGTRGALNIARQMFLLLTNRHIFNRQL
jgi:hypothetical protein